MYPATIISVNPHIVQVDEFKEPKASSYGFHTYQQGIHGIGAMPNNAGWMKDMNDWLVLSVANWQLPVHEDSVWEKWIDRKDGNEHYFQKDFQIGQKVSVKEIKEGKAVIV